MSTPNVTKPNHSISFFDIGDHVIRVEASYLTGKESVYVDDELISEKLTWRFTSEHKFELDGKQIAVRLKVGNLFTGPVSISLWVNGEEIDSDIWNMKRILKTSGSSQPWWKTILTIFALGLIGGVIGYFIGYALATALKG